jgi:hypothetical protein
MSSKAQRKKDTGSK